jgi:hypothetical protein
MAGVLAGVLVAVIAGFSNHQRHDNEKSSRITSRLCFATVAKGKRIPSEIPAHDELGVCVAAFRNNYHVMLVRRGVVFREGTFLFLWGRYYMVWKG